MLLRLVNHHLRPYLGLVTMLVVLQLASTIASLSLPNLNGRIIDEGVSVGDTGQILRLGGLMLAISLVQILATVAATWLAARSSAGLGRDLRARIFHHVGSFSAQELTRFGAPTLISRTTNDVTQVQQVVFMALAMMITAPITMIGGVIMALRTDLGLTWLVVVAVPLLGGFVALVIRAMVPNFRKMQQMVDTVNRILREQITGIRVVRAFVREDVEEQRFAQANTEYTGTAVAVGRLMAMTFPVVMFMFNVSTVAVLWFGAHRIENGDMLPGAMTAFISYMIQILMSVMMATMMSMMIPRATVSAGRIDEVLDTSTSVVAPANPVALRADSAQVELRDVTFCYPGAEVPVVRSVSLAAQPGQTTAIIGSTGAGKSTLLGLIPRLYDVTGGAVLVDGTDVREVDPQDLWAHIGLVPQKPYLFTGTIASNLRFAAPDATDEDLWEALRVAQAADFVSELDDGLDSAVAQGGTNFSGGQRQRLAIARALVRKPSIYLFDDSFSALDTATDARLRAALRPWTRQATVIVVAQRVSSIIDADQIVVMEDGVIAGIGTYDELLSSCGTFAEIVASQRGVEEAA